MALNKISGFISANIKWLFFFQIKLFKIKMDDNIKVWQEKNPHCATEPVDNLSQKPLHTQLKPRKSQM